MAVKVVEGSARKLFTVFVRLQRMKLDIPID